ncbi:methionyl-tRNA formyltransferase [Vibrio aquaticus]|uniref:Methionyl-tRNA formyltransferase n=1 Tax=Vibrio aquaticus TaxID=2496559 RepID=A0A432CUW6_9VIBR|nr:formyltransferase family protein [Vibrio aquaticus]RTZ14656.1 methionyl-tRNA formyltransferase [Vibrio aquaticus]
MNTIHTVNILVDNDSWILPYAKEFACWCESKGLKVNFARAQSELLNCDISFFIGCVRIVSSENLNKSRLNLVVHESALPAGKGFAPVAWQILEGKRIIPICLLEATNAFDSGDIWVQESFSLIGVELYDEWRRKQGEATLSICQNFINRYPQIEPKKQRGLETFYARRTPNDSELDIDKTIREQFELLRIVDNNKFPAFFSYRGKKYKLEISEYAE